MEYYSHVLYYPSRHPFDRGDSAFFAFVGEFVLPIVEHRLHEHFWFTHYGNCARFRVLTDRYAILQEVIRKQCAATGLEDRGDEKDLTLVGDLGHDRFLAANRKDKQPESRAMLVLRFLHAIAELVCDNVLKGPDGYWVLEKSENSENPNGSNFESLHHLFCNSTQLRLFVHLALRTDWMPQSSGGTIPISF